MFLSPYSIGSTCISNETDRTSLKEGWEKGGGNVFSQVAWEHHTAAAVVHAEAELHGENNRVPRRVAVGAKERVGAMVYGPNKGDDTNTSY